MRSFKYLCLFLLIGTALAVVACDDDESEVATSEEGTDTEETTTDTSSSIDDAEWYAGGVLGTVFNASSYAYSQPTPAVENAGMESDFKLGELFYEAYYNLDTEPYDGLGPLYVRKSCDICHPGYGHGKRVTRYRADDYGNGYLLVLYDNTTNSYITSLTGMPQTKAQEPFKAPLDEEQIEIEWVVATDEWGNAFDDGETYELIYPVVTIPYSAHYAPVTVSRNGETVTLTEDEYNSDIDVRLEVTIGIYGSGLLDAIPDDSLKVQYAKEEAAGVDINTAFFSDGEWVKQYSNTTQGTGEQHPYRYTYALTRGALQDGPGANAIWNITNVTRSDRRYHYMTTVYATAASQDEEVQDEFYTYYPDWNITGDPETDIYNYLMNTELPVEMSDDQYVAFMVWHRGLAVPAARDLDDEDVIRGHDLFRSLGCSECHRPSWTTGADILNDPNTFFEDGDSRLPNYPYQTIWPYTDLVQHRLYMVNDIRTGWCRTTPLWGRGLSLLCSGHSDRMHDARARSTMEAIMWHGYSAESDARWAVEAFRELDKEDRDAVVKFIDSI